MTADAKAQALDRHALAVAIWLTAGVVAATAYHFGVAAAGPAYIAAAFAMIVAAFIGHVVVNEVFDADFSPRELALGLVTFGVGLIAFGLATLFSSEFSSRAFLSTSLGFVGLAAVFVFYLIAKSGLRSAFDAFDTIRSFRARAAGKDH